LAKMVKVGVLALQGGFIEHVQMMRKVGAESFEVRTVEEISCVDALILPGGESTTIATLSENTELLPTLRSWVKSGKPIWGTCAGLIFMADELSDAKEGGQAVIGGLRVKATRNFYGRQNQSFETPINATFDNHVQGCNGYPSSTPGIFIRAPHIAKLLDSSVVPLGTIAKPSFLNNLNLNGNVGHSNNNNNNSNNNNCQDEILTVAVRQGNILATTFHPELTRDTTWHEYFLRMITPNSSC